MDNLPSFITSIDFPHEFNKSINNLPHSVNEIELNDNFNQDISLLPNSITHIVLNVQYCKFINNIPSSVKYITLSYFFFENLCDSKFDNILNLIEKIYIRREDQYTLFNEKYHHKIHLETN